MKDIITFVTLLLVTVVYSQSYPPLIENNAHKKNKEHMIRFGTYSGVNLADQDISNWDKNTKKDILYTLNGGILIEFCINDNFSLESGIGLTGKGYKAFTSETNSVATISADIKYNPFYVEVPLHGLYKINLNSSSILLFAGPYIDYGVFGKYSITYSAQNLPSGYTLSSLGFNNINREIRFGTNTNSDYRNLDYGINAGLGFEIKKIQLRAKYSLGIANNNPDEKIVVKNKVISGSLGYIF